MDTLRTRAERAINGLRNGVSIRTIAGRRSSNPTLRVKGVDVQSLSPRTTWRIVKDIWMDREYDVQGFVPEPGWRVVDIGANVGIYAMLAAARGASVTCWEAHPGLADCLRSNVARWGADVHHAAVVGKPVESVTLYLHPERDTRNTLMGQEVGASRAALPEGIDVPAVTLSDALVPCDLLKVDIEGGEFDLLAHEPEAFTRAQRIVMEVHTNIGDPQEASSTLERVGFAVETIRPHGDHPFVLLVARRTERNDA